MSNFLARVGGWIHTLIMATTKTSNGENNMTKIKKSDFPKPSQIRSWLRDECETKTGIDHHDTHVPVYVVDGHQPPKAYGARGGYFTHGGSRIAHPGAYAKKGWSNMIYICSTQKIKVGRQWLRDRGICPMLIDYD
jgi:hypothetical protein